MLWVGALLAALFIWGIYRRPTGVRAEALRMEGLTMGTTWSIRIADARVRAADVPALRARVEAVFAEINRQMSTYDPGSEISRFNEAPPDSPLPVSSAFAEVVRFALVLAERSGGAFDPTVAPLVELWGFGRSGPRERTPTGEEIEAVRAVVGFRRVGLDAENRLSKEAAGVRLDLNAVAKGYGVDAAARALEEAGLRNFFVEVGGEVVARGERAGGGPWRIGVDRPRPDAPPGVVLERVLRLSNIAVATSGDYRNFRRDEATGEIYAHIFDPRTGRPVRRMAGSVTVVADTCLVADGLATALYVMGPEEGLEWLPRAFPGCEALFLLRRDDGSIEERATPGFAARTE